MIMKFITKDSGKRKEFDSGMRRDVQEGKPRFDLIIPAGQKYEESMLYRWAMLMERGMNKYGERNWEKAGSKEEMARFKASAFRHFVQWIMDVNDGEDHAAGVMFNINAHEYVRGRMDKKR